MNIILVVGPSGSGKDTLLRNARKTLAKNEEFCFARRYITRPPDSSEDNYYLDPLAFRVLEQSGFFLSSWQAHDNSYGIAEYTLNGAGRHETVICSVSRVAIPDFEARCGQTVTIEVTASMAILKARLLARGRESETDIDRRLARAKQSVVARNRLVFDNSLPLEESCFRFTALLLTAGTKMEKIDRTP